MRARSVLIADDQPIVLAGLRNVLADFCTVVDEANDGRSLVEAVLERRPDLIILAVALPLFYGIDAARQIRARWPEARLLFLTMHRRPAYLQQAFKAGARGYVLKTASLKEIRRAVEFVFNGKIYISSAFGDNAREYLRSASSKPPRSTAELTPRQREILQLIAEGRSNKEVANLLRISVKTVGFHRERIMHNLGVHTTAHLALAAVHLGLITVPDKLAASGLETDRNILEHLWRTRLKEAKKRVDLATARVKQVQEQFSQESSSDGNFALAQAIQAENDALAEYEGVRRIYTDLAVHGTTPDESDWATPSGGEMN